MPNVYIISGPNGSGKTYLSTSFVPAKTFDDRFVNADQIESTLVQSTSIYSNPSMVAGRMMLRLIQAYADEGVDFVFETTLASKCFAKLILK